MGFPHNVAWDAPVLLWEALGAEPNLTATTVTWASVMYWSESTCVRQGVPLYRSDALGSSSSYNSTAFGDDTTPLLLLQHMILNVSVFVGLCATPVAGGGVGFAYKKNLVSQPVGVIVVHPFDASNQFYNEFHGTGSISSSSSTRRRSEKMHSNSIPVMFIAEQSTRPRLSMISPMYPAHRHGVRRCRLRYHAR